jgi:hypothetical protein
MAYVAVIGDLVASRQITNRAAFQRRLARLFADLSSRKPGLLSPYTITLGDEFQALYANADRLFADLVTILAHVHPLRLRLALGVGEITTAINDEHAIGMDGPAFHAAREVMDQLKPHDDTLVQTSVHQPGNGAAVDLLNRALSVVAELTRTWKQNTWAITRDEMAGKTVEETADKLSITTRAVYKNMRTNGVRSVIALFEGAAKLLNTEVGIR